MKLNDCYAELHAIHVPFARIAEWTKIIGQTNCGHLGNPDWISIMDRQDSLLDELGRLDTCLRNSRQIRAMVAPGSWPVACD